jgi:cysteine-rich repeat protein
MGGGGTFEQCDDGNSNASDGCDASCNLEPGFACPEPALPCRAIVCGDGIADWPAEECDDGNDEDDDGCTDCRADDGGGTGGIGGMGGFGGTVIGGGSGGSAGSITTGGVGGG